MNWSLSLKGTLSLVRLSNKPLKGGSEIGIIMVCFFLLLFVIFPVSLMVQEFNLYKNQMRSVQTQTEMTCYDIMTRFDFNALSEGYLLEHDSEAFFRAAFEKDMAHYIAIENLDIHFDQTGIHDHLYIRFTYPYLTQIVFKAHIEKQVVVSLKVVLPLNE